MRLIPAQAKLAFRVVMMAGSNLKSEKRKRLHSANKLLPCNDRGLA
jgi:hypothetical protein